MSKTKILKIRISEEEREAIRSKYANVNISRAIRDYLLNNNKDAFKSVKQAEKRTDLIQIARIGNNINQIARQLNTSGLEASEFATLNKRLLEIRDELRQV